MEKNNHIKPVIRAEGPAPNATKQYTTSSWYIIIYIQGPVGAVSAVLATQTHEEISIFLSRGGIKAKNRKPTPPNGYDGMSLHCLLCLLHYNAVSLCRGFVTTELVSLQVEESAQTLGVLDVDGYIERTVYCEEHTAGQQLHEKEKEKKKGATGAPSTESRLAARPRLKKVVLLDVYSCSITGQLHLQNKTQHTSTQAHN